MVLPIILIPLSSFPTSPEKVSESPSTGAGFRFFLFLVSALWRPSVSQHPFNFIRLRVQRKSQLRHISLATNDLVTYNLGILETERDRRPSALQLSISLIVIDSVEDPPLMFTDLELRWENVISENPSTALGRRTNPFRRSKNLSSISKLLDSSSTRRPLAR